MHFIQLKQKVSKKKSSYQMKWRKWNRIIHRDVGYFFFGMFIIYGISGIALNHNKDWNPDYIISKKNYKTEQKLNRENVDAAAITRLIEESGLDLEAKKHYYPSSDVFKLFVENGSVIVDLNTGEASVETIRNRPFFREVNFLHYNKPKKLWTWFSDIFAGGMVLIAITGLFIVRGKKGITGRGAVLTIAGAIIPLVFLIIYLW